ncbi:MAG: EamA family transporter [Candidatus Auribacterota bacterium]|nr:EamA family transporter [Candidatus Auribacterota bacterium]
MKNYLILLFAIICNACANIFIKIGMTKFEMPSSIFALVKRVLLNPAIIGGIFLFVLALGAYAYILSKLNLSIAYPIMTSLGYMIVILISWLFLKETITMIQTVGFILIILGVWFVAR